MKSNPICNTIYSQLFNSHSHSMYLHSVIISLYSRCPPFPCRNQITYQHVGPFTAYCLFNLNYWYHPLSLMLTLLQPCHICIKLLLMRIQYFPLWLLHFKFLKRSTGKTHSEAATGNAMSLCLTLAAIVQLWFWSFVDNKSVLNIAGSNGTRWISHSEHVIKLAR